MRITTFERLQDILQTVNQRLIKKVIVQPMSSGCDEPDALLFTIGTKKYTILIMDRAPRHAANAKSRVIEFINLWNSVDTHVPITRHPKEDRFNFKIMEQSRLRTYEFKVYHQSTVVDKAWVRVDARNPEEAKEIIMNGDGDWVDSKQVDTLDGEYVDQKEWTYEII